MNKTLTIQIQNPCSQKWEDMQERSIGKYCHSCNKTVVDFTNFSDEQLINFFQKPKGSVCGRIEEERLNTPLIIPPLPKRNRIQWLFPLTAILSLIGINKVKAQDTLRSVPPSFSKGKIEKVSYDMNNQEIKVRQDFIEIEVLDINGKPITNKIFEVKCYGFDTLKYLFDSGLIRIPTNQFKTDGDLEIGIYNNLIFKVVSCNQFTTKRNKVVFGTKSEIELLPVKSMILGGMVMRKQSRSDSFANFQIRTINETIRYLINQ